MTKASDVAYTEAKRLIAAARDSGATELALDTEETRALTQIPPDISTLTALTSLDLSRTQVTDLTPLTHLTALTTLNLRGTPVTDLRPLSQLTALTTLELNGTPVTDLRPLSQLTALTTLELNGTPVTDLRPLSQLTALTTLELMVTQVTDLTPLTHLTALTILDLSETQVTDLRPLLPLTRLATDPEFGGLTFANTPFAHLPPFDDIAAEKDPATRAQRLFAALQGWVPPGEVGPPPEPAPLFRTLLTNGQLELSPDPPTQKEQDEALKQALHQRLQNITPELARVAGNTYYRLAGKARVLDALVEKPFDQLDFLSIHFEIESLQDRLVRGSEDGVAFTDDVMASLADVTRVGPGLTLGHPSVDIYIARVSEAREHPTPDADEAIHAKFSQVVQSDAKGNGPNSRAMEGRIAALEDKAERQAGWLAKHQWFPWAIGGLTTMIVGPVSTDLIVQNFGPAITAFVSQNAGLLLDLAATYGAATAFWFGSVMAPIFLALGIKEEIAKRQNRKK